MSKERGVFAHFGSREDLQVEVVREYHGRFEQEVFYPALQEPRGLPRLRAMMWRWIDKRVQEVTTGCIYISGAVEYDDRAESPVRAELVAERVGLAQRTVARDRAGDGGGASARRHRSADDAARALQPDPRLASRRALPASARRGRAHAPRAREADRFVSKRRPSGTEPDRGGAVTPRSDNLERLMGQYAAPLRGYAVRPARTARCRRRTQADARVCGRRCRHHQSGDRGGRQVLRGRDFFR